MVTDVICVTFGCKAKWRLKNKKAKTPVETFRVSGMDACMQGPTTRWRWLPGHQTWPLMHKRLNVPPLFQGKFPGVLGQRRSGSLWENVEEETETPSGGRGGRSARQAAGVEMSQC